MNESWTDKLIDAHLEAPSAVEPSLGFESRLLANAADQRATRRPPIFWMVWASAAVAAVIIAIVFFFRPLSQRPVGVDTAKTAAPTQAVTAVAVPTVRSEHVVAQRRDMPKRRREAIAAAVSIRQEVFPAPSPLSEQEQLAFAYLRATPRSEVIAMSRRDAEIPQEIDQVVPGPEVNRTLQDSRSGSTR